MNSGHLLAGGLEADMGIGMHNKAVITTKYQKLTD